MRISDKKISFIGLGKLGLGLALSISDSGIKVIGIDNNKKIINKLKSKKLPIFEPGLGSLLKKNINSNFFVTQDKFSAIEQSDVTYILIQTPSKKNGRFNSLFLEKLITDVCLILDKLAKKHHTLVICSTLQPGTIVNKIIPLINAYKNLNIGENIGLVYNPESVALGEIKRGFQKPNYMIIGESDDYSGRLITKISKKYTKSNPEIVRMSLTSGEISKITLNAFLCMKISFANHISQITRNIDDANQSKILKAIGYDKRIGTRFLKAGPSFGGTCFPRDVIAFSKFNHDININSNLIDSVKNINDKQHKLILKDIRKIINKTNIKNVCIFGYAFKENTPVTYLSPSIELMKGLQRSSVNISVYDKYVQKNEVDKVIKIYRNMNLALRNNNLIILMHNHFEGLDSLLCRINQRKYIYDTWSNFKVKNSHHLVFNLDQKP
ncbi:nucleotide sugar dehydrogenase [Pelagibacteraceae bacterium]|nr:nucleotide sugar dehydrogenase [Pelagibacteraceae bacterium]